MGGLISLYAGLKHPDVFGRVGVFSPAVWFAPQIWSFLDTSRFDGDQRYYLLAGGREGSNLPADIQKLEQALIRKGHTSASVLRTLDPNGTHTEAFWAAWFGPAYQWLFAPVTGLDMLPDDAFKLYPNPVPDTLHVSYPGRFHIALYDALGHILWEGDGDNEVRLPFAHLAYGPYVVRVTQKGRSLSRIVWRQ